MSFHNWASPAQTINHDWASYFAPFPSHCKLPSSKTLTFLPRRLSLAAQVIVLFNFLLLTVPICSQVVHESASPLKYDSRRPNLLILNPDTHGTFMHSYTPSSFPSHLLPEIIEHDHADLISSRSSRYTSSMDSFFLLTAEARGRFLQIAGRLLGCTYVCAWSPDLYHPAAKYVFVSSTCKTSG